MRRHDVLITEAELVASPERVYAVLEARAAKRDRKDEGFDREIERGPLFSNDPLNDSKKSVSSTSTTPESSVGCSAFMITQKLCPNGRLSLGSHQACGARREC